MAEAYRKGQVFVQQRLAGVIAETDEGYLFSYAPEYLQLEDSLSVSLTMPLTEVPYRSTVLFPFFDGLIPEGWLLKVVNRNWKIDSQDRFGLLLAVCRDCVGDVQIVQMTQSREEAER